MSGRASAVEAPWYGGGLRFTCTQCGHCCSGEPGYVWVTAADVEAIAARLEMSVDVFERRHVREVGARRSLKERPNGDCEFLRRLDDGRSICSIYENRPRQCKTWPFWNENLESAEAWADASRGCPGMNNGRHYSLKVIQSSLSEK